MNSRMSCVVIFLALCLYMNVHSSSAEGSKGNDLTGQLNDSFVKYLCKDQEGVKLFNRMQQKFKDWSMMQQKKQANKTTHEVNTTKPTLKSSSTEELSTRPLSTPTILLEMPTKTLVTHVQEPTPSTSKTTVTKSVANTTSKPSTKTPTSKQKSPTSKIMVTKSVAETTSKPSTKAPTSKQKSPTSKTTTTKSVADTTSKPSNSSTKNATIAAEQLPSTSEPTTTRNGSALPSNKTKQAESMTDQFVHRSNFGVLFMVILVVIVAVYIGYHNRNKIHKFIKRGFSTSKHIGPGYLKVKLEDDIDLPREANRQYIY